MPIVLTPGRGTGVPTPFRRERAPRSSGGGRVRAPGDFAVHDVQGFHDPGIPDVNSDQFGAGIAREVTKLGQAGQQIAEKQIKARQAAELRMQNRRDTIDRIKRGEAFSGEILQDFTDTLDKKDITDPTELGAFGKRSTEMVNRIVAEHRAGGASEDSVVRLFGALSAEETRFRNKIAVESVAVGKNLIAIENGKDISTLSDRAADLKDPADVSALFDELDDIADERANSQSPDEDMQFRVTGREQITLSAVEARLDVGEFKAAQTLLDETPGAIEALSPEADRKLKGRIATLQQAEIKARTAGERKLNELETILGRKATPAERVRAAGVAPPAGRQTPLQKIEETEAALGRPLTAPERARVVGLEPVAAVSPEGKVVQDRTAFVTEFGEGSEQVRALDEATRDSAEKPSLSDVAGQRKEFTKLSSVFVNVRDSFNRVTASVQDASPAGDLALIFNFMKILDPGSVVRESEFAQAAATGSFGQRLRAAGERLLAGKRLTKEQRADFADRADMLMQAQVRTQLRLETQFHELAVRTGINPADVVLDFVGPFRSAVGGQPLPGGAAAAPSEPPKPRFKVDLNGNIIGGP